MKKLIYVPLEAYQERYTEYQSVKGGVYETAFKKYKVPFIAIRPHSRLCHIKTGVVLDASKRCEWAFEQTQQLVQMIIAGKITSEDVIYFEDFWHPGMEMIPYALSLKFGNDPWPEIYSFWHAQSVDRFDFTYPMRHWMRTFEHAWVACHDRIFIASKEVAELIEDGGLDCDKTRLVGLPYDSKVIKKLFNVKPQPWRLRKKQVVFSSRWDEEKCPDFFCSLANLVRDERNDIDFVVCTGAGKLRSNNPSLVQVARDTASTNNCFRIEENLTKRQYFQILARSRVQFNCANQDFVSLTILDATTMGCKPLYPNYLTFPDVLQHNEFYLYTKDNLQSAAQHLYALIDSEEYDVSWVYKKYENTVPRMLEVMGFIPKGTVLQLPEVVNFVTR